MLGKRRAAATGTPSTTTLPRAPGRRGRPRPAAPPRLVGQHLGGLVGIPGHRLQRRVIIAGHGFVQNLRRGHYELAAEEPMNRRVAAACHELALAI
jgi:hypothetical protein